MNNIIIFNPEGYILYSGYFNQVEYVNDDFIMSEYNQEVDEYLPQYPINNSYPEGSQLRWLYHHNINSAQFTLKEGKWIRKTKEE